MGLAMSEELDKVLPISCELLREVNLEIDQRFHELSPDMRALLIQKGAMMQSIFRELNRLLEAASEKAEQHDWLLDRCEEWRRDFLIPLREQSTSDQNTGKKIEIKDLMDILGQVNRALAERDEAES